MVWMVRPSDQRLLQGAGFEQETCQEMVYLSHALADVQLVQEDSRAARSIEETLLAEQL